MGIGFVTALPQRTRPKRATRWWHRQAERGDMHATSNPLGVFRRRPPGRRCDRGWNRRSTRRG